MSDALVWQLVKDNNAFLVKRGRTNRDGAVQFSREAGNLLNVNSFKYSGLANRKAIDIAVNDKNVTLAVKAPKKNKKVVKVPLNNQAKLSQKVIANQATNKFYRADLTSAAASRYSRVLKDVRVKKGLAKKAVTKHHRHRATRA